MNKGSSVLERKIVHKGKVFIKEGEENSRAYVIQKGKVRAFTTIDDEKIEIAIYGPGTIIGESCLVLDDPMTMSYETLADTTVATITRQDFQKKLQRVDSGIQMILKHVMTKLSEQAEEKKNTAFKNAQIDTQAYELTNSLLAGLDDNKKFLYEKTILPIVNNLVKALKKLKKET